MDKPGFRGDMMWFYSEVSREEFERRKDHVEQIMCEFGALAVDIELSYESQTTTYSGGFEETYYSKRPVFTFNNEYFRVDEILFKDKPFIVLECGTFEDLKNNTMEDADPFPYDLSDEKIKNEVRYSLGIEPHPLK